MDTYNIHIGCLCLDNVSGFLYICGDMGHISQYPVSTSADIHIQENIFSDRYTIHFFKGLTENKRLNYVLW